METDEKKVGRGAHDETEDIRQCWWNVLWLPLLFAVWCFSLHSCPLFLVALSDFLFAFWGVCVCMNSFSLSIPCCWFSFGLVCGI